MSGGGRPSADANQLRAFLDAGIDAARVAADIVRAGWNDLGGLAVDSKGRGDVVTNVDREAEHGIIAHLHAAFPEHGFLGEESGASGSGDFRWIVDPLDGTLNFAHGLQHFCISIALARGPEVLVAVVLDPLRGELFHSAAGSGAWLNGRRLTVSTCETMEQALLATVFPKPGSALAGRYRPILNRALDTAAGIRRGGSMVLDLAYVAAGRLDGFWEFGMHPWDVAAGSLLVSEAGGTVATIEGNPDILSANNLMACTPGLAPALRMLCREQ